MKWIDSLFSWKKRTTKLKDGHIGEGNRSETSYRDIKKRKNIDISGSFQWETNRSLFERNTLERCVKYLSCLIRTIQPKQKIVFLCLLVISMVFYLIWLGYRALLLRDILTQNPLSITEPETREKLQVLKRELTLFSPIIANPLIPLEPIRSYVVVLDSVDILLKKLTKGEGMIGQVLSWWEVSDSQSIFPLIDDIYSWIDETDPPMQKTLKNVMNFMENEQIQSLSDIWNTLISERETLEKILGKHGPSRILFLNQNSDELRAGWGFPGTAFIIEFDQGVLKKFQLYDIYALDWKLKWYRPSPEGINQFRSLDFPGKPVEFEMRDANYYPAFSESAMMLDALAQEAWIGKIDLVVWINQKMIEDLISLVEPLHIPGVNVPIDHHNAMLIVSMLVEAKVILEKSPKNIINTLVEILFQKLEQENMHIQVAQIWAKNLLGGEIVMGSSDPEIQKSLVKSGLFDSWVWRSGDWVYPIFTSISRNKSDRIIERTFTIQQKSECNREVTLKQKHWFDTVEDEKIRNLAKNLWIENKVPMLLPIQWKGDNVHYLRFIVPVGSKLIRSSSDFIQGETHQQYSIIHGYVTLKPDSTQSVTIEYELPRDHCSWKTAFIKQSGLRDTQVVIQKDDTILYQKYYK